jgi:hypothetical protein
MPLKEKGRRRGDPIPNAFVRQDNPEFKPTLRHLQVCRLVRLYAVNAAMAEALAPLVFLEVLR